MIFAHANPAPAPRVEHAVAVAPSPSLRSRACLGGRRLRRERLGFSLAGALAIQTLVGKVRKDACPARYEPRCAAVFVNARADIEAGGRYVSDGAVRTLAHDHVAALLLRPRFEPVDLIAIDAN